MTAPETLDAPAAPAKPASLWEDFIDIFFAPAAVFARRRLASFWPPMLVYAVFSAALFLVARPAMQPVFDQMQAQQVEKMRQNNPRLTAEQIESAKQMTARFSTPAIGATFGFVGSIATLIVLGVVVWGVARAFGMELYASQGITIASYAAIPRLLTFALTTALAFVSPLPDGATMNSYTLSPARFIHTGDEALQALLSRFDLGTLWATALVGIGVAVIGRRDRGRGFTVAGVVWLLATLVAMLNGWRASV